VSPLSSRGPGERISANPIAPTHGSVRYRGFTRAVSGKTAAESLQFRNRIANFPHLILSFSGTLPRNFSLDFPPAVSYNRAMKNASLKKFKIENGSLMKSPAVLL
jgi:hypothetical protein